jgi:O-acetylserine/cysteine efflux transporter
MSPRDRLSALLVAVVWGINFPATALALDHFPPFLLVAVRYALIAIPTILLVPRPKVPLKWLLGVGFFIGTVQFAGLYLAMSLGLSSGLASIVLQASAPFTVLLAVLFLGERLSVRQVVGIAIAVAGLVAIAVSRAQAAALVPILVALVGALGWALGNISSRKALAPNALHLTLWASVVPPLPMAALSFFVEGPERIGTAFSTLFTVEALPSIAGLLYIVLLATLVGYGIWNRLLATYPSSTVAPFSMLVPVVGVLSSWLAFGELPDLVELLAGGFVVGGVLVASIRLPRRAPLPEPQAPGEPSGERFAAPPGLASNPASIQLTETTTGPVKKLKAGS